MEDIEALYGSIPDEIKNALESVIGIQELPAKNPRLIDYKASLSGEQFLWLFLHGEQKDWQYYSNMDAKTRVRDIDDLLEELYASFENAEYRSDKDGLSKEQWMLYDYIISQLLDNTESAMSRTEARAMRTLGV